MSNVNKKLKEKLKNECEIVAPEISVRQQASDGTIKYALVLEGGQEVEAVWIPEKDRATLCVSSQVGCALECPMRFTATPSANMLTCSSILKNVFYGSADFIA